MFIHGITNSRLLYVFIVCALQLFPVNAIPINFANSKNNYNENHANRPLLPNQLPGQRPPPHQQQQQNSPNVGPEMEDFGRLHTNQNQFRRHAIVPPDGKVTPGAAFQPTPPEQFGKTAGSNFHQNFEDSLPNPPFRQQHNMPQGDMQDNMQQPHGPSNENIRQTRSHNRYHHDMPPPVLIHPRRDSRYNSNLHREEDFARNSGSGPSFDSYQNENFHGRHTPPDNFDNHINPYHQQHSGNKPSKGQHDRGDPPRWPFKSFSSPSQLTSQVAVFRSIPIPPTAVVVIVEGPDGNSTLFIEYDVEDNSNTYETTMEVEDVEEARTEN